MQVVERHWRNSICRGLPTYTLTCDAYQVADQSTFGRQAVFKAQRGVVTLSEFG